MSNVAVALRDAARLLEDVSDTARLDAELLMADALGLSRSEMLLKARDLEAPAHFARSIERRRHHEPVAYIVEHREFYGREFLVNSEVLIPRGDSETVVEVALANCADHARILDLGIGSGALILTLLAEKPESQGVGIDASLGAVAVAAANAANFKVSERAHLLHLDWNDPDWKTGLGRFDLIVANPPYVETDADLEKSVRDHEPANALFAGADGLDDYRILVPQMRKLLAPDGCIVLEIGYQQDRSVAGIAADSGFSTELFRDLAHRPRALLLR